MRRNRIPLGYLLLIFAMMTAGPVFGKEAPIRVAIFQGPGVGSSYQQLIEALKASRDGKFEISRITAEQIREGKLVDVDVLVHPGGSGSKQGESLGEQGRVAVRNFVRSGGGYLGVCAGAYLATNDYTWSLNLIDAKVVDKRHWARGNGEVKLRFSPAGSTFFHPDDLEIEIRYAQGPLLARKEWDDTEVPDYESLAVFATEIAENGAPRGVMAGTSAAVRCEFGTGRVFCFSPHPELTEGLHPWIPLAVEWLAAPKTAEAAK